MKTLPDLFEEFFLTSFWQSMLKCEMCFLQLPYLSLDFLWTPTACQHVVRYVCVVTGQNFSCPIEKSTRVVLACTMTALEAREAIIKGASRAVAGRIKTAWDNLFERFKTKQQYVMLMSVQE